MENDTKNNGELYTVVYKTNDTLLRIPEEYTDRNKAEAKLRNMRIMASMVGYSFDGHVEPIKKGSLK